MKSITRRLFFTVLLIKDGNGGWRAIEGAAFTSADDVVLEFERPTSIKGTLGSSTSPALIWSID